jgi:uncharacterized membrane protein YjfL (UPF0719 family)
MKGILQLIVFALVFTTITTHQAWGEGDCYYQKVSFLSMVTKPSMLGIIMPIQATKVVAL